MAKGSPGGQKPTPNPQSERVDADPQPPKPARLAGASARLAKGGKSLNAGSATGLIAYFGSLDLTPHWKGLLLLSAPWLAIAVNTIIGVIGIYASGYSELYLRQLSDKHLKRLAEGIVNDAGAPDEDKREAAETIKRINTEEIRIRQGISAQLGNIFQ